MSRDLRTPAETYFAQQADSNEEYWRRYGGWPQLTGKHVLELGCGHGAMTLALARRGATVVAVDLDVERVEFARAKLAQELPGAEIQFVGADVSTLPADPVFDIAVSKDTFEHVQDVPALLRELHLRMKPGGLLYVGLSPLYFSPFGDHAMTGLRVPWAHAVLPRRLVLAAAARYHGHPINDLGDLTLNGMTAEQLVDAFEGSPFTVQQVALNEGDKRLLRVLSSLRKVRPLRKFATVSIYAVLVA